MGHVAELRRAGIAAGAPLFIPGLGAMILLRKHIDDPVLDARIGLAGPVWGLATALVAFGVYAVTKQQIWFAIAELGAWINLFNLIPVWQLDGARGFHALSRPQRWAAVAVIAGTFWLTAQKFLLIVGAVAIFRAFQRTTTPGHTRTLMAYSALVIALGWLSRTAQ
jgi:Zn-dependent protease